MQTYAFELPLALEAHEPPELRGLARDGVKLLVAHDTAAPEIEHTTFDRLTDQLSPGDLLVINVSATLPSAVDATRADGSPARVHFSTRAPRLDPSWRVAELRTADGCAPARGSPGETLLLSGGATLELVASYASGNRLHLAHFEPADPLDATVEVYLHQHGEPIRYGYLNHAPPLDAYQNVYATTPGSAEMPSAGRPFTSELIVDLVAHGIGIAPLTLHCGVSSPERHEPPFPEPYEVPVATTRAVESTRSAGGRVIAVGTTVVRALETVTADDGRLYPGAGWTNVVISPDRGVRSVDGLITGWHEPEASHLMMLETIAGRELLERSYDEALAHDYLWHEFGDSHLILTR